MKVQKKSFSCWSNCCRGTCRGTAVFSGARAPKGPGVAPPLTIKHEVVGSMSTFAPLTALSCSLMQADSHSITTAVGEIITLSGDCIS